MPIRILQEQASGGRGSIHHARVRMNPGGANGHGGRDECCPYHRSLA
ncbi:MAG TPA: hypothetical protein VFA10_14145 [Ktedonobacteraceae bacterium]|nr:hypothetical protein [Ktedonobacteraceae bacterium]